MIAKPTHQMKQWQRQVQRQTAKTLFYSLCHSCGWPLAEMYDRGRAAASCFPPEITNGIRNIYQRSLDVGATL
jgi:hypothetical protein